MQRSSQIERFRLRSALWVACLIGLLLIVHIERLAAEGPRFAISTQRVAEALSEYGLKIRPQQVRLPSPLTSAIPSPQLELVSMRTAAPDLVQIELRCQSSGKCLPFFVLLDVPAGTASSFTAGVKQHQLASTGAEARTGLRQYGVAGIESSTPRIRAGDHIALLLEDSQMRIQIPTVALDSGAPGLEVRVCTLDHRKIFRARVVSSSIARGGLE